tara:strand:+ start:82 stop:603 length:522 start_codon:yes stop_codon:yes gene_type:complete
MKIIKVRENLDVIVDKYPYFESLNRKLIEDAARVDYSMSYKTNVKAKMSSWKTNSENINLIVEWVNSTIISVYGTVGTDAGYIASCLDAWFSKYGDGEHAVSHTHYPSTLSFVYFVRCPKGSSPLILTTSGKKIKAEEGKVVIFPGGMQHHVPKNKCHDRIVLAGNIGLLPND